MDSNVKTLMFDTASNTDIYDDEVGRVMTNKEVNETIKQAVFEDLGLNEKSTEKQIKRALASDKGIEFCEVIEEIVDTNISYGLNEDEFFNQYVEKRNLKDGDRNEFWVDDDVLLGVSKLSGDNHDITIQRLGAGNAYSVPTAMYGIKVGSDFRLFLTGRKDWSAFVNAATRAFNNKIQTLIASQFATGVNIIPIPSTLTGNGQLDQNSKAAFDSIIEKVGAANEAPVVIMGSKTALKNLNNLAGGAATSVNWIAEVQKTDVANSGILGNYEGTPLYALPQKFLDKTLTTPIVDNTKIYIMPQVDNRFIKFVDGGEAELTIDEYGKTKDDLQSYEIQRRIGVGTLMTRYFGVWTI